jgi:hypothetical protein
MACNSLDGQALFRRLGIYKYRRLSALDSLKASMRNFDRREIGDVVWVALADLR